MSEYRWATPARARLLVGDAFDRMAELPDESVDLVLTSPPFLALRSYLPDGHPDKAKEIGSEPDPASFLDTLLRLTAEWRRLLAPHGSIAVELGDTYSGSGGAGGDYNDGGLLDGQPRFQGSAERNRPGYASFASANRNGASGGPGWPLPKSLCQIPELYRIALAYGIHPLTGEQSPAGRWRVRNVVRWCRPNPPVGALGDKFRPATTDMVIACLSRDRWFDLDAVRTQAVSADHHARYPQDVYVDTGKAHNGDRGDKGKITSGINPGGVPPLDWWDIPTQPYKGAHYATWPKTLLIRPVLAMCPPRVCTTCGAPSRRITEATHEAHGEPARHNAEPKARADYKGQQRNENAQGMAHGRATKHVETLGWTDCGHGTWRPGHVLDPFAGSGTTLEVAHGHGRDATGIDLDPRNTNLAVGRLGMFLDVDKAA